MNWSKRILGPMAWRCVLLLGTGMAVAHAAAPSPPPLATEHLSVEQLGPLAPHWIYLYDAAFANGTDTRLNLFDGDKGRLLGQIDAGYFPGFAVSPDHQTIAVATTYWSRGWHGTRTDVLEFTDAASMKVTGEVALPPKRAQGPPTLFNIAFSHDQRLIYSTNITPAASISVVDFAHKAVLSELDTDGCVLAIPSLERRVSAVCENGRLLSIVVDDQGHEVSRGFSDKFFNADKDPVFVQAIPSTTGVIFVSFLGEVHEITLGGPEPIFAAPWSVVLAQQHERWRPGGVQPGALHKSLSRLYVAMHEGGEGTHKNGGSEIWVYDTVAAQRVGRWFVDTRRYGVALAVQVTQDAQPLLFVATETSYLLTIDAMTGRLVHAEAKMGQTPWYMMNP